MIPQRIGRYEVKAELGRGGMATVYAAHDPRFRRDVAVKVLPREFLHDLTFRARFEREAQTIAALEHPAIVPVYDFGEDEGQPFLVMRYMPGGSLGDRLHGHGLPLTEAVRIVTRLAPALDEAHALGIIHRDLKPGNILFDQRNSPYISDFGIAKISEAGTAFTGTAAIIGTPAYISPEQGRGEEALDGRSDVYALGAILFEMLTGKLPYEAATPMGLVIKHLTEPVPRVLATRPGLPEACETVVARAMAKDRDARFATAGALAAALESAAQGGVVAPPPELVDTVILPPEEPAVPTPATRRPERRRRLILGGWLLGGLATLSLLGLWLGRGLPAGGAAPTSSPTPSLTASATADTLPAIIYTPTQTPAPTKTSAVASAQQPTAVATTPTMTPTKASTAKATSVVTTTGITSAHTAAPSPTPTSQPITTSSGGPPPTSTPVPGGVTSAPPNTPRPTATPTAPPPTNAPPPTATLPPPTATNSPPPSNTPTPADTQGPGIGNLSANPSVLTTGCTVTFSADISDPSGVASATVNWQGSGGKSGSAPMSGPSGGGTWSASAIVSAPLLGSVDWSVTATDMLGNSAQAGGPRVTVSLPCP